MILDTKHFKELLEKEVAVLETELTNIGRKNPEHPSDWEISAPISDRDRADETEVADDIEGLENNQAVLTQLEIQLNNVKSALDKIEKGKYGVCEVGGEKIELDRLEANPSAKTCKLHMN